MSKETSSDEIRPLWDESFEGTDLAPLEQQPADMMTRALLFAARVKDVPPRTFSHSCVVFDSDYPHDARFAYLNALLANGAVVQSVHPGSSGSFLVVVTCSSRPIEEAKAAWKAANEDA